LEILGKNEDGVKVSIGFSDGIRLVGTVLDRTVPYPWEGSSLVGPTETGEFRLRFDPLDLKRIEFGN
jgi:hypothetical protein